MELYYLKIIIVIDLGLIVKFINVKYMNILENNSGSFCFCILVLGFIYCKFVFDLVKDLEKYVF